MTRMGRAPCCFRPPGRGLGPGVGGPPSGQGRIEGMEASQSRGGAGAELQAYAPGKGRIEGMEALSIRPWPDRAVLWAVRIISN